MLTLETFHIFLAVMSIIALAVFVALYFVEAGYGYLFNPKFGFPVPNKIGWVLMESPVFIAMCALWACSDVRFEAAPLALFLIFQTHYFQRSFIFPMLMRGNSKMPFGIVAMGMLFNTLNALMQGGWIFYLAPQQGYYDDWFSKPYIYIGAAIFFAGFFINLQSDSIIRNLRKPGDTKHYIPREECSASSRRRTTSANLPNGSASPSLRGRFRERCSHGGPSPTSHLAPIRSTNVTKRSSAMSSARCTAKE